MVPEAPGHGPLVLLLWACDEAVNDGGSTYPIKLSTSWPGSEEKKGAKVSQVPLI